MKVVVFGATGMIGSRIVKELQARGHHAIAAVRDTTKLNAAGIEVRRADILDRKSVELASGGAEAVVSAYSPGVNDAAQLVEATRSLIDGVTAAGVRRLLTVGGAGSLAVSQGMELMDTPQFPAEWKSIAGAHRDALNVLKACDLDWTNLSPAAIIGPGTRTGKFRLSDDQLLTDGAGESRISAEDYAVAMVNEIEKPQHVRARFAVAY